MYTCGDSNTVLLQGANALQVADDLSQVVIDDVAAASPVGPVVDGHIVGL